MRWVFLAVASCLYALDQITKLLVVDRLTGREDVSVVGDLLVLHLTRNPGAAFSTGTRYTVVLSVLAVAAVVVVLILAWRTRNTLWAVALAVLLAGVGGNLTDRIARAPGPFRGHVVDFLALPHWPVFNVADMCINVAAVLILVQAVRGVHLDGSRTEARPSEPAGQPMQPADVEDQEARDPVKAETSSDEGTGA